MLNLDYNNISNLRDYQILNFINFLLIFKWDAKKEI